MSNAYDRIRLRFQSGNSNQVESARITADEWDLIENVIMYADHVLASNGGFVDRLALRGAMDNLLRD